MPKKRNAPKRELARAQGVLNEELLTALGKKRSLAELDRLWEEGARADETCLHCAAEDGGAQGLRWVLSKLPEPDGEEERETRDAALWWAMVMGSGGPAKVSALIQALRLPRKIEAFETHSARRALERAAKEASGASFSRLLEALDPPGKKELADDRMKGDYLSAAAETGDPARVRLVLDHPKHGPAMGPRRRAIALSSALRASAMGSGKSALGVVKELFETASAIGDGVSALAVAAIYNQDDSLKWMLDRAEGKFSIDQVQDAAARAREANSDAASLIEGWLLARGEREQMEAAARRPAPKAARPARRV